MTNESAARQLLGLRYPGNLDADVAELRQAGRSWRWVANAVTVRSGVSVSHETMRAWFAGTDAA